MNDILPGKRKREEKLKKGCLGIRRVKKETTEQPENN